MLSKSAGQHRGDSGSFVRSVPRHPRSGCGRRFAGWHRYGRARDAEPASQPGAAGADGESRVRTLVSRRVPPSAGGGVVPGVVMMDADFSHEPAAISECPAGWRRARRRKRSKLESAAADAEPRGQLLCPRGLAFRRARRHFGIGRDGAGGSGTVRGGANEFGGIRLRGGNDAFAVAHGQHDCGTCDFIRRRGSKMSAGKAGEFG